MIRAGILGGTGYAGEELIRLLYNHKEVEITKILSDTYQGRSYSYVYRSFTGFSRIVCEGVNYDTIAEDIDILFTSLPYGVLMQHLTKDIMDRVRIIDIGVDYRLMNSEEYRKYYGMEHQSLPFASEFDYGLCEWNREQIRRARHIANPGCYATAIELALLPLIAEGYIGRDIIIDGKTSYSGSGRTLTVGTHYTEANESVKPYRIGNHPHSRESRNAIRLLTGKEVDITFVPHMVPMQRGLLVTCYTSVEKGVTRNMVEAAYQKYYSGERFIERLEPGMYVETKWVRNSNMCHINYVFDEEGKRLIVFAAIDNLIKGAAGQAIQNMNLMFSYPEEMALDTIPYCI